MKQIEKPKNKKSLTKVKEQWFQEGLAFKQIIDYNKIIGGSMWTKEQQADLDARELKLNNKIDANAQGIKENRKAIEEVKEDVQELKSKMNGLQNSVDNILSIIKDLQTSIKDLQTSIKDIQTKLAN